MFLGHSQNDINSEENYLVGLGMSNCCAIEIIDNKYRLLTEDASNYNIESYGIKTYWKNNKYIEKYIDKSDKFKYLEDLLTKG